MISGVFSAAATPLTADLSPDHAALAAHCRQLIDDGCHGIALLGTTGEANSFSVRERMAMLEAVASSGVEAERLLPGTGVSAFTETVELTRHAVELGAGAVVMLPPFYYKGVSDAGLLDAYSRIIEGVADDRLRIVLYHIPQISQIPLGHDLIAALMKRFPGVVVGIKDSGGPLDHMISLIRAFPDLAVLAGADPLLLPILAEGGAGCITATSNLAARQLRTVFDGHAQAGREADVRAAQDRIVALREASNSFSQIPTIKAMLARRYGQPGWMRVRPPLVALNDGQIAQLEDKLAQIDAAHHP